MGASFPLVFDATFEPQRAWWIDGDPIPRSVAEVVTPSTLTLTFRVTDTRLQSILRPLKPDEGKVDVLQQDDGGFLAIDRAGGGNTYQLDPPDPRQPLRQPGAYHVRRYEERAVAQRATDWEVEVEFVRAENRTDSPAIDEIKSGAAFDWTFPQAFAGREGWEFTTRYGTFATDRVDADVLGTGEGAVERFELTTRLDFEEAHAFEAALARVNGARVKSIPDAPNVAQDATSDDAVTVTINAPDSEETVSDGAYVVVEPWESRRVTDAFQEVSLTVAAKD